MIFFGCARRARVERNVVGKHAPIVSVSIAGRYCEVALSVAGGIFEGSGGGGGGAGKKTSKSVMSRNGTVGKIVPMEQRISINIQE